MAVADFSVDDLGRALDRASDDMKRAVGALVERAAQTTKTRVQAAYPVGPTGTLRRRVSVGQPRGFATTGSGTVIPALIVRASAPHVHIWQEGTVERFDSTRANARRGRSPRHGRVMEAIAAQTRQEMLNDAQALVTRDREL